MWVRIPCHAPMATTSPDDIIQFRGKNIRRAYARLLTLAEYQGVHFELDSAYRSIKEQWRLWWLYKSGKGPVAAFPGTSTHNKRTFKQGLDINAKDGGVTRFRNWAMKHSMYFDLTVQGEAWHVNARGNYDHLIYTMWHAHQKHLDELFRKRHAAAEADRKAKQHRHG